MFSVSPTGMVTVVVTPPSVTVFCLTVTDSVNVGVELWVSPKTQISP